MRLNKANQRVQEHFNYAFNDEDPGSTDEIDLCCDCFDSLDLHEEDECVAAPPYEDYGDYVCAWCGKELTEHDNYYV